MSAYQFRVSWRRSTWARPCSKTFGTEDAARRHVDRLTAGDRDDLAPLDFVRVDFRAVESRWTEHETVIDTGRGVTW